VVVLELVLVASVVVELDELVDATFAAPPPHPASANPSTRPSAARNRVAVKP
jgi:hypothetical protein